MARIDPDYEFGKKRGAAAAQASAARGKYPWDEWLGEPWGRTWVMTQDEDFPGVKAGSFIQAARNAATRRGLRAEIDQVDERTVALRVTGERDD